MERNSKYRTLPFLSAHTLAHELYALDVSEDTFIEMGYKVWRDIGNIAPSITRYFVTVPNDAVVEVPNGAEFIESVTSVDGSMPVTTFDSSGVKDKDLSELDVQGHNLDYNQSSTTSTGSSINYVLVADNRVKITSPGLIGTNIMIVYRDAPKDEDGLPLLNDKEVAAIAAEVAKRMLMRNMFQGVGSALKASSQTLLIQYITAEATKLMAAAKIDELINDDALDKLLDLKTTRDSKVYGKRIKLIK